MTHFDGIQIREDANGSLVASVSRALSTGNDGHGINFDENRTGASDAEGDLTASVSNSTSIGNTDGAGVRADQPTPPGVGSLLLTDVDRTTVPNADGPTTVGVTVTVAP